MTVHLFCFPWAGGNGLAYRDWHEPLTDIATIHPVNLPGHGPRLREPLLNDLSLIVATLYAELTTQWHPPFAFWGHSMGAIIALELAYMLQKNKRPLPTMLFLSAHRAPHLPNQTAHTHTLPDAQLLAYIQSLGGTTAAILGLADMQALMLPIIRADLTALNTYTYQPRPPLPCPIIALGGLDDATVSRDQLMPWQTITDSKFSIQLFPGDHFYLQEAYPMVIQFIKYQLRHLGASYAST